MPARRDDSTSASEALHDFECFECLGVLAELEVGIGQIEPRQIATLRAAVVVHDRLQTGQILCRHAVDRLLILPGIIHLMDRGQLRERRSLLSARFFRKITRAMTTTTNAVTPMLICFLYCLVEGRDLHVRGEQRILFQFALRDLLLRFEHTILS